MTSQVEIIRPIGEKTFKIKVLNLPLAIFIIASPYDHIRPKKNIKKGGKRRKLAWKIHYVRVVSDFL